MIVQAKHMSPSQSLLRSQLRIENTKNMPEALLQDGWYGDPKSGNEKGDFARILSSAETKSSAALKQQSNFAGEQLRRENTTIEPEALPQEGWYGDLKSGNEKTDFTQSLSPANITSTAVLEQKSNFACEQQALSAKVSDLLFKPSTGDIGTIMRSSRLASIPSLGGETVINGLPELSAFEHVNATRFDSGSLFGHATHFDAEYPPAPVPTQSAGVLEKTSRPQSNQVSSSRHLLGSSRPDLAHFVPCYEASFTLLENANEAYPPSSVSGTEKEQLLVNQPKHALEAGDSQLTNRLLTTGKLKSRVLTKMAAMAEPFGSDNVASLATVDADTNTSQRATSFAKAEALLAALRTNLSLTMVAIHTLDQGLRVFARTGRLSVEGRQKLREDMVAMMAQHGLPISQSDLSVDEMGVDQDPRRSAP